MPQKRKPDAQLTFVDEAFTVPDVPDAASKPRRTATKPPVPSQKTLPPGAQPYLPGLSRRGRPRLKDALAPTVRARESRKRRVAAGGKRVELVLEAAVAADLEALVQHQQRTRIEIITRLIERAAKRLPKKSD